MTATKRGGSHDDKSKVIDSFAASRPASPDGCGLRPFSKISLFRVQWNR